MENNNVGERLAKAETRLDDHKEEIDKLKEDATFKYKLTVNQEVLTNIVKENQVQMKEFSNTLVNINSNITQLNTSNEAIKEDLSSVQTELEEVKKGNDRGRFDVIAFISQDLPKALGIAILGFLLAYFGLK